MQKINLEEILQDYYLITLDNCKEIHAPIEDIKPAMIEFGKQLLELAVDNVLKVEYIETGKMDESVCSSILDTIKQVE